MTCVGSNMVSGADATRLLSARKPSKIHHTHLHQTKTEKKNDNKSNYEKQTTITNVHYVNNTWYVPCVHVCVHVRACACTCTCVCGCTRVLPSPSVLDASLHHSVQTLKKKHTHKNVSTPRWTHLFDRALRLSLAVLLLEPLQVWEIGLVDEVHQGPQLFLDVLHGGSGHEDAVLVGVDAHAVVHHLLKAA